MGADCSARPGSVLDTFTVIDIDYPEKASAAKGYEVPRWRMGDPCVAAQNPEFR